MTTLTKTEAEAILERCPQFTLLDVLERMEAIGCSDCLGTNKGKFCEAGWHNPDKSSLWLRLLRKWQPFGFKTSLQEIFNRLEWEWIDCDEPRCEDGHYPLGMDEDGDVDWGGCPKCVVAPYGRAGEIQVAKPSPFADLFIYLKEIGL